MAEERIDLFEGLHKAVESAAPDLLRELLQAMVVTLMGAEVDALCGAGYGERSPERVNARNGYRPRPWDTRVGTIDLALPKLRQGTYFPVWLLEPRRRAERALVAVVAESYVLGVSTRKVEDLVQTLGITRLSKSQVSELAKSLDPLVASFWERPLDGRPYSYVWLDALALRCREGRLRRRRCRRPIHHPSRGGSAPRRRSKLGGCREAPVHHLRGRGPEIEAAGVSLS